MVWCGVVVWCGGEGGGVRCLPDHHGEINLRVGIARGCAIAIVGSWREGV